MNLFTCFRWRSLENGFLQCVVVTILNSSALLKLLINYYAFVFGILLFVLVLLFYDFVLVFVLLQLTLHTQI